MWGIIYPDACSNLLLERLHSRLMAALKGGPFPSFRSQHIAGCGDVGRGQQLSEKPLQAVLGPSTSVTAPYFNPHGALQGDDYLLSWLGL
jgi:hypothetical protein